MNSAIWQPGNLSHHTMVKVNHQRMYFALTKGDYDTPAAWNCWPSWYYPSLSLSCCSAPTSSALPRVPDKLTGAGVSDSSKWYPKHSPLLPVPNLCLLGVVILPHYDWAFQFWYLNNWISPISACWLFKRYHHAMLYPAVPHLETPLCIVI